jgi:hypothetical protein
MPKRRLYNGVDPNRKMGLARRKAERLRLACPILGFGVGVPIVKSESGINSVST